MDLKEYIQVMSADFQRHPWELTRLRILRFFITNSPSKTSILDIGSGDGFLATGISKYFPSSSIIAVDINYEDDVLSAFNNNKPQNLSFQKNLTGFPEQKEIDIIILMDVLEHIEYPETALNELLSLPGITPKTRLIITVPAFQGLFSAHDINLGHFRRYNLKQLNDLLKTQPIQAIDSGYFFNSLIIFRFFQRLFENKNNSSSKSIHNWKGGRLTTNIIASLFWLEFKITWYLARIGLKIPGLTCYCICQPSPL